MDNINGHSTSKHDGCDDILNFEKDVFTSDIELPKGKKLRLNPPARLLSIADDSLGCILLNMLGCKKLDVVHPRLIQNMVSSYGFIYANNRMLGVFHDLVRKQVRVIDANYPFRIDEDVITLPTHKLPMNICFLAKTIGGSLRTLSLPCYFSRIDNIDNTVEYEKRWTRVGQSMMLTIAKHCTNLNTITFQDSGIMEQAIAERFLATNPELKRIVVHSPSPAFLSALTKSDCVLDSLILLHVGPESLGAVLKFLREKGESLDSLSIETSAPFTDASEPSSEVRARYKRMVKLFTLHFEKIARANLKLLTSVVLQPFKESQWYKEFILRFQRMGRAKLITGSSSGPLIYNPTLNGVVPPVAYKMLHLDYVSHCETEDQFRNYLERVELPDSLSIESINFFFKLVDSNHDEVSTFVRAAIREKGHQITRLRLACTVYSKDVFTEFLNGMSGILDTFEESFGSLTKLQRLDIPIDLITHVAENRGDKRFLARLSNLREIFLDRPLPYMYLDVETPKAIPTFLKYLTKACRTLKCVCIPRGHQTCMRTNVSARELAQAKEVAWGALDEFEDENPEVDVHTLRVQVMRWEVTAVSTT